MVVGLSQAEGDFALPDEPPRALLLISGGSGITPVMSMLRTLCDEGHAGRSPSCTTRRPRDVALPRRARRARAPEHPNVRCCAAYTRATGGDLHGPLEPRAPARDAVPRPRRGRDLRLRPARPDRGRALDLGAEDAEAGCTSRASCRPRWRSAATSAEGVHRFAGSGAERRPTTAARCSSRPRPPASPRVRLPHGHLPHLHLPQDRGHRARLLTGEISTGEDEDIQICVSAPVGDVALDSDNQLRTRRDAHEHHLTHHMTPEQLDAFGAELDAIRERVLADLGERDADLHPQRHPGPARARDRAAAGCSSSASCRRPGSAARPPSRCPRSSTTWRSATTSCTASTTG